MDDGKLKVLVVDDEQEVLRKAESWLTTEGYLTALASEGAHARALLATEDYALVMTDFAMPGLPVPEVIAHARASRGNAAVLLLINWDDREAVAPLLTQGAGGYVMKPLVKSDFLVQAARALERREFERLRPTHNDVSVASDRVRSREAMEREEEIIFRLVAALGVRSDESTRHVRRVGFNAALLARHLGWGPDAVADIRLAASMHDIGEVGVPDSILLKPGRLSPEEFALIKKHTEIGAKLLEGSSSGMLRMARDIALCHHEKWDGGGYPQGLAGTEIPEAARIVAVVDVYDVLVSERVYRPPLPEDEAYSIMEANRGKYFEPRILDCFLRLLPEIELVEGADLHEEDVAIDFDDAKTEPPS